MNNQRIYKQYIGQYDELVILKKWFLLYHHVLTCILNGSKTKDYINEKLNVLKILYTYKKEFNFKEYDIIKLNKFRIDLLEQFSIIETKEYSNFNDLENDKLIIFNIIESFFIYIKKLAVGENYNLFFKQSKKRVSQIIPTSKFDKILYRIIQNLSYYIFNIVFFSFIFSICMVFFAYCFALMLSILNYLPEFLLQFLSTLPQEKIHSTLITIVIIFSVICSAITAFFMISKSKKRIQIFMPEKGLAFARDVSENQLFFSIGSLIISILALLSSIVIALFNNIIF